MCRTHTLVSFDAQTDHKTVTIIGVIRSSAVTPDSACPSCPSGLRSSDRPVTLGWCACLGLPCEWRRRACVFTAWPWSLWAPSQLSLVSVVWMSLLIHLPSSGHLSGSQIVMDIPGNGKSGFDFFRNCQAAFWGVFRLTPSVCRAQQPRTSLPPAISLFNFHLPSGFVAPRVMLVVKEPASQCRRHKRLRFDPWVGEIPWRRAWQPTPVFFSGESHGHRSLVGCSPWGH